MILLKILVALLMLALIAAGSYSFGIAGLIVTLLMSFVLNSMFNRWDARRTAKKP